MAKQQQSLIESFMDFVDQFDSDPFQDFYVLLVLRFLIYIYLFIKLSDILLGYEKPNLKTRVLRKFQFVYGDQILKELDKEDMQQLEVTINNTILNATKELKTKNNHKNAHQQMIKDALNQSERRSLRMEQISESSGSSLSRKSSKLRFDLQKNEYYDPPIVKQLVKQEPKVFQTLSKMQERNLVIESQQVEGQNQQDNLSPTSRNKQFSKIGAFSQPQSDENLIEQTSSEVIEQASIHYPEKQLEGMDLQIEEKFVKAQENLLHLSDDILEDSLIGNQTTQTFHNQDFETCPSVVKTESTKPTESFIEEMET